MAPPFLLLSSVVDTSFFRFRSFSPHPGNGKLQCILFFAILPYFCFLFETHSVKELMSVISKFNLNHMPGRYVNVSCLQFRELL